MKHLRLLWLKMDIFYKLKTLRKMNYYKNGLILKPNNELTQGIDEDNVTLIPYVWLGATDNDDTNGTVFDEDANLTTQTRIISANEGDWKWLNGASWVDADAN